MLLVNDDNNNDELFRRAAENYPLKTDNPDWEAVLNKMNSAKTPGETEIPAKKRNRNYRFLLLLLLLIPFAIVENRKTSINTSAPGKDNEPGKTATAKTGTAQASATNIPGNNSSQPVDKSSLTEQDAATANVEPTPVQNINNTTTGNNKSSNNDVPADASVTSRNSRSFASANRSKIKITNAGLSGEDETVTQNPNTTNRKKDKKNISSKTDVAINIKTTTPSSTKNESEPVNIEDKTLASNTEKKTAPVTVAVEKEKEPVAKEDVLKTTKADKEPLKANEKNTAKQEKKNKPSNKRFYLGLIAGPDFSAVKLQSVKKTGLGFGLIAGYQLTKRISIETGIIKDKKYYNTDGKYFNTKDMNLPAYTNIGRVEGGCNMWELPLNVNYTFSKRSRSSWFGSVGVSSYFMRHESYTYDVSYGGYVYPKAYDYDNRSTSFLAAINISAGYSYELGKIGSLRIQPYVKLPVNKIGTGKLPVQSAGIYLGLTKNIF